MAIWLTIVVLSMFKFIKSPKFFLLLISTFLFLIPFVWLKPGEMDLGGDSNRLYFYDPINYLKNNLLYAINPGFGNENPLYLSLPFVAILVLLKQVIPSSYFIITLFNSLKLVVAFMAMFGITKRFLDRGIQGNHKNIAYFISIFVGFYYVLSPVMVRSAWDKALLTHFQVFLNPLLFFLFLRFMETSKIQYLLIVLIVTFIFSTNFSWAAAPPLLAFYPLAFLYLFIYAKFILKKKIPFKPLIVFSFLFLLIHSFHLVPLVGQILGQTGDAFAKAFTSAGKYDMGLNYFLASASTIVLSKNLIGLPQLVPSIISFEPVFIIFPFIFVYGLLLNGRIKELSREQKNNFLTLSVFFLISVFLVTANVTKTGLAFYAFLFNIPGFSMFRNYYGQWEFIYTFFFSLITGLALYRILIYIRNKYIQTVILGFLFSLILISSIPFIRGDMINIVLNRGQKVEFKVPVLIDPDFEKALVYLRRDPYDGKVLLLPHTEAFNHMVAGTQGGMYQGPSMISALAGKKDFAGYQVMKPFSEAFLSLAKKEDKEDFMILLAILNVKYIFYNSDPSIINYFPDFPYSHVKNFLPQNQNDYKQFIASLSASKKESFGKKYHIYEIDKEYYLPHIYVAEDIVFMDRERDEWGYITNIFFESKKNKKKRTVYIENKEKSINTKDIPTISFKRVNPTKYYINVSNATAPYALVFSDLYNPNWKIYYEQNEKKENKHLDSYFNGSIKESAHMDSFLNKDLLETWEKRPVAEKNHYVANAYANTWLIYPKDTQNKKSYTLILELTSQRYLYIFLPISIISFIFCVVWLVIILLRSHRNDK